MLAFGTPQLPITTMMETEPVNTSNWLQALRPPFLSDTHLIKQSARNRAASYSSWWVLSRYLIHTIIKVPLAIAPLLSAANQFAILRGWRVLVTQERWLICRLKNAMSKVPLCCSCEWSNEFLKKNLRPPHYYYFFFVI